MGMTDSDKSESETAQEWFCPNCGDEIDAGEECESWPCAHCGTEMEPITRKSEYIPIEVLEELVDRLRNEDGERAPPTLGKLDAANRLEQIIEDHR